MIIEQSFNIDSASIAGEIEIPKSNENTVLPNTVITGCHVC